MKKAFKELSILLGSMAGIATIVFSVIAANLHYVVADGRH